MNCKECDFYSNKESNDFGRTYIIKCNKSGIVSDSCSENSADEYRATDNLQSRCPLNIKQQLKEKLQTYKLLYVNNIGSEYQEYLFNELIDLISKL